MLRFVSTFVLLVFCPLTFADPPAQIVRAGPPKIVASPSSSVPVPPVGAPVQLDAGKFLWLDMEGYDGAVEWDFSAHGLAVIPPAAESIYWGGWKQGDSGPGWYAVPKGSVPLLNTSKVDDGKFDWFELPDLSGKRIGGTKQGDASAKWYDPPSKVAVPLLGVKPGTLTVSAWGVVGTRPKKLAEVLVSVGGASPDDGKKVEPVTAKDVYIVIVKSAGNLTPVQANLIGDVKFWDEFKVGKTDWSKYNQDDEISQKKGYTDLAMKVQTGGEFKPVLIVLDSKDGTKLYADFLPATKDEVRSAIAKVRK